MPKARDSLRIQSGGTDYYFPEARLTLGPLTINQSYSSFSQAYGTTYAYLLDDDTNTLRIWAWNGTSWSEVPSAQFPQPPHPVANLRHFTLVFEPSGKIAMAYEYLGNVYVYAYDSATGTYKSTNLGALADPILVPLALVNYQVDGIPIGGIARPVALFALSSNRLELRMGTSYEAAALDPGGLTTAFTFSEPAILDQAAISTYQITLYGSFVSNPTATGFRLLTEPQGVDLSAWTYQVAYQLTVGSPSFGTVGSPSFGDVGVSPTQSYAASAGFSPPLSWRYEFPIIM